MYYADIIFPDGITSDGEIKELPIVGDAFEEYTVEAVNKTDEEIEPGVPIYEVKLSN